MLITFLGSCKSVSKYAIDEQPNVKINNDLVGIWKMREDTDKHNFFVIEKGDDYHYNMTYMNRGGDNRLYEHWSGFMSEIGNTKFLNVSYYDWDTKFQGYFFLKIIDTSHHGWEMTGILVTDTTLKDLKSSAELRARIAKNLNNRSFYGDTLHFRRRLTLSHCPENVKPIDH